MILYPKNAHEVTEFQKIINILEIECNGVWAKKRSKEIKINTQKSYIQRDLDQVYEFRMVLQQGFSYPNIFAGDLSTLLKNLSLQNFILTKDNLVEIRLCIQNTQHLKKWFRNKIEYYPTLNSLFDEIEITEEILIEIDKILDEHNFIKDNASKLLFDIRKNLNEKRYEHKSKFERIKRKLKKDEKLADTEEAYYHNRRVLAVLAEYKRQIKGILHGESESAKTVYIEPEETIDISNQVQYLEMDEHKEIQKIFKKISEYLQPFIPLLKKYQIINGLLDFIRAKAKLAIKMDAHKPILSDHAIIKLEKAYHPLLYLLNEKQGKPTISLSLEIAQSQQVIIISGPNAGGKTVAMKTVALLQIMLQAGLLIPCAPNSEIGIFKQLFIQIGDTQSLEQELSTYSAHLGNMNHFLKFATNRTLFFIDELGSGSDPHLGGVFAEVILEELVKTGAKGIVTTHYLNLKTLADKEPHMINAAMLFDEESLQPLYKIQLGKPGSSYTFAIAQRVGIPKHIIQRASKLVKEEHFRLENLLRQTEKKFLELKNKEDEFHKLNKKNADTIEKYEKLIENENAKRLEKQLELQNKIKQEELDYLRDLERKFKQIIQDWKKAEDKSAVIESAENLLFKRKVLKTNELLSKKIDKQYKTINIPITLGVLVRNKDNDQVGEIMELKEKIAKVKIGNLLFSMNIDKLIPVEKIEHKRKKKN